MLHAPHRRIPTALLLATLAGCSGSSSHDVDGGVDSAAGAPCTPGQPVSCPCPGSTSSGMRICTEAGLGPCIECYSPIDGGGDSGAADTGGGTSDGAAQDAPTETGPSTDAAMCTPDDLTCEASAECCNDQCVGGACCFALDAGACGIACVASGSGVACTHDYDCCGKIFGSTCKSGLCCNATGQLCNGNDSWCCSGVCSGTTCS
jgi:hypothetical protein